MSEQEFWGSEEQIRAEILHWVWSTQTQIYRYDENLGKEMDSGEAEKLDRMRMCSLTSYDEHLILVAARNLIRAIDMLDEDDSTITIEQSLRDDLKELRDIYEHWDITKNCLNQKDYEKSRSAKKFMNRNPSGRPFSVALTAKGSKLAGVVDLNILLKELKTLETVLVKEIEK